MKLFYEKKISECYYMLRGINNVKDNKKMTVFHILRDLLVYFYFILGSWITKETYSQDGELQMSSRHLLERTKTVVSVRPNII